MDEEISMRDKEKKRLYDIAYRVANKDKLIARGKSYRETHKSEAAASNAAYRMAHKTELDAYDKTYNASHKSEMAAYAAARYAALKFETIEFYGGKCACCGEGHIQFLTIDHINGDGAERREREGLGGALYQWLKKNGYPSGFQVLCYNCNCAKRDGDHCPHQDLPGWAARVAA